MKLVPLKKRIHVEVRRVERPNPFMMLIGALMRVPKAALAILVMGLAILFGSVPAFATDPVSLPSGGVDVGTYAQAALTTMGTQWGTIIAIGFVVLIVIIMVAWAFGMLRGRKRG